MIFAKKYSINKIMKILENCESEIVAFVSQDMDLLVILKELSSNNFDINIYKSDSANIKKTHFIPK